MSSALTEPTEDFVDDWVEARIEEINGGSGYLIELKVECGECFGSGEVECECCGSLVSCDGCYGSGYRRIDEDLSDCSLKKTRELLRSEFWAQHKIEVKEVLLRLQQGQFVSCLAS